jgi:hypothetical protein
LVETKEFRNQFGYQFSLYVPKAVLYGGDQFGDLINHLSRKDKPHEAHL